MKIIASLSLVISIFGCTLAQANYANFLQKTRYTAKSIEECETKNLPLKELASCLDVVKAQSEKELKIWVNNQIFILEDFAKSSGRVAPLRIFKQSQQDFVRYRKNNCNWQYIINTPGLTGPPAEKKCFIRLTNDRINELSQFKID